MDGSCSRVLPTRRGQDSASRRLSSLYDALQSIESKNLPSFEPTLPGEPDQDAPAPAPLTKTRRAFSLPILLQRQFAIFKADIKNLIILLAQPIIIGALVAWAASDPQLEQFFAYIATLWFGCSNSAQEIVKELPIYRRERLVGLSRWSYLTSKFIWMAGLTAIQALLLYATIAIGRLGVHGAYQWQIIGLILLAFAATGIGLTMSAFARSPMQAVMLVPLLLIPQILFSGFTVPAKDMAPSVLALSQIMPSFASAADLGCQLFDQPEDFRRPRAGLSNRLFQHQRLVPIENRGATQNRHDLSARADRSGSPACHWCLWTIGGFICSSWLLGRKERE